MRSGNVLIQSREDCVIRAGELNQVAVRDLLWRSHLAGKMGNIVIVGNEGKAANACPFQAQQEGRSLSDGESVRWSLRQHAHESEFGDGARCKMR